MNIYKLPDKKRPDEGKQITGRNTGDKENYGTTNANKHLCGGQK